LPVVTAAALLAHQGGWDEILFVLAPLVLFAFLLLVARRRVDRMESDDPITADPITDDPIAGDPLTDDADRR
jgi:hypothetical protein